MITCPLCKKNTVGKVGSNQYYCCECFIEFMVQEDKISIFKVCDDGTLIPYKEETNELSMGV